MALGDTLKNAAASAGNSLMGNLEQAMLEVVDLRATFQQLGGPPAGSAASTRPRRNTLSGAVQSLPTAAPPLPPKKRFYKVKFNPSELQIDSSIYAANTSNAVAEGQKSHQNANARPAISLSMRLYFDEVNLADSFMWEKFTSGVSVQTGVNIATAVAGAKGKVWTVQTQVEGLVAALRNLYTRKVYFHWADFTFGGQLQTVMAQYTMFSTSGRPVRAVVSLRLRQDSTDDYNRRWWDDEFKKGFGITAAALGSGATSVSGLGTAQKMSSLINFG